MSYIQTGIDAPGILELLFFKSSTGTALSNLAHTLLHGPSPLTSGEREIIAAYVSYLNNCEFCHLSHKAAATAHSCNNSQTIAAVIENIQTAPVSEKIRRLLLIAGQVPKGGKHVHQTDIDHAKAAGASDEEIHDTVLIAAAFCMFNRYVDGLGTTPAGKSEYEAMGQRMKKGYKLPPSFLRKAVIFFMNKTARQKPSAA